MATALTTGRMMGRSWLRISDDGRFQEGGHFGKDTFEEPQLRACLRGRAYRHVGL